MTNEELIESLNSLLSLLNEQQKETDTVQEKFQVALTGVLRLLGEGTPTLSKLHGNAEDIKGYLIQLNTESIQSMTKSYQVLRGRIEELIKSISVANRKS